MRKPAGDSPPFQEPAPPNAASSLVRNAFLRQGPVHCQWPADFVPPVSTGEPLLEDLAHRIWQRARPELEAIAEGFNRLVFNQAVDRASSALFATADIGIKQLTQAKEVLGQAFAAIEAASQLTRPQADSARESREAPSEAAGGPTLVARLDATPPALKDQTPGRAHLSLALGDVVVNLEVKVPSQSWLYRGYTGLKDRFGAIIDRVETITTYRQPPGRLGMMTDDRELTLGLRRIRTSDAAQSGKPKRETTFTVHSRS